MRLACILYSLWVCLTKALASAFLSSTAPKALVPLFKTGLGFIGSESLESGQDPKEECHPRWPWGLPLLGALLELNRSKLQRWVNTLSAAGVFWRVGSKRMYEQEMSSCSSPLHLCSVPEPQQ